MITEQIAQEMEYCQLAADWLEANGWCQGEYFKGGTPDRPEQCCIEGALNLVVHKDASVDRWTSAHDRLQAYFRKGMWRRPAMSRVNDEKGRTVEEVISFLRHAGTEKSEVERYD